MTSDQRRPKLPDTKHFQDKDADLKLHQQSNLDDRHLARRLSPLPEGSPVFLPDRMETGHIVSQPACRSYVVSTPSGQFRRNRRHINPLPLTDPVDDTEARDISTARQRYRRPAEDTLSRNLSGAVSCFLPRNGDSQWKRGTTALQAGLLTVGRHYVELSCGT